MQQERIAESSLFIDLNLGDKLIISVVVIQYLYDYLSSF